LRSLATVKTAGNYYKSVGRGAMYDQGKPKGRAVMVGWSPRGLDVSC